MVKQSHNLNRKNPVSGLRRRVNRILASSMLVAVSVTIVVIILVLISYERRPMFATKFGIKEMDIWPRWHIGYRFSGDKLILVDKRLNTVAFILTGSRDYRGNVRPFDRGDNATLPLTGGPTLYIPKVKNTLFLFNANGSMRKCTLAEGQAADIDLKIPTSMDLGREFDLIEENGGRINREK